MMDVEQMYEGSRLGKKMRLKIITNRNLQFLTSIKSTATISDLANRALSVYLQLIGEREPNAVKKQLTVSAVKQGVFYMPKSQCISNLLNTDDQVELIIIKAKPKYPNQLFQYQYGLKKNTPISFQHIFNQPKHFIQEILLAPLQEVPQDPQIEKMEQIPNLDVRVKSRGELSKKQRKKDKKKQKKVHLRECEKEKERRRNSQRQQKQMQQKQVMPQSFPRKKLKIDKEEITKSPDKFSQIVIPSPKITFHAEPKIDSPRFTLLDSQKKRNSPDLQISRPNPYPPKPVEEELKKTLNFQKVVSPSQPFKSPAHNLKTPTQVTVIQDPSRGKEKQQFLNFSLSRKLSDDRTGEIRGKKSNQEGLHIAAKIEQVKEIGQSSMNLENLFQEERQNLKQRKEQQSEQGQAAGSQIKKVDLKPLKNVVIMQPPSDSDSEENKNTNIFVNHSRAKELAQIKNRINSFLIESEDEA